MSANNSPPAFPGSNSFGPGVNKGMTLRDWFAGHALPSVAATISSGRHRPGGGTLTIAEAIAADAYALADAMLAERAKP